MWATVRLAAGSADRRALSRTFQYLHSAILSPATQMHPRRSAARAIHCSSTWRASVAISNASKAEKEGALGEEPRFRYRSSLRPEKKRSKSPKRNLLRLARNLQNNLGKDTPPHARKGPKGDSHSGNKKSIEERGNKKTTVEPRKVTGKVDVASKVRLAWHEELLKMVQDGEVDLTPQIEAAEPHPSREPEVTETQKQPQRSRPAGSSVKVPYDWASSPNSMASSSSKGKSASKSPFGAMAFSSNNESGSADKRGDRGRETEQSDDKSERRNVNVTQYRGTVLYTGDEATSRKSVRSRKEYDDSGDRSGAFYMPIEDIPTEPDSESFRHWHEHGKWHVSTGGKMSAGQVSVQEVIPLREMEVPRLAHGLDRVLFNEGVHWLRDNRTGIYNFEPRIRDLHDVDLFDYSALPPYQTSSADTELAALAHRHAKRYSGSTSSMTGLLSHMYFALSAWQQPPLTGFTEGFKNSPRDFSFSAKLPANVLLRRFEDGQGDQKSVRYAIDQDKVTSGDTEGNNYVLTQLGKSVEKLLTSPVEEYEQYLRINSHRLTEEEKTKKEAYHYSMTDKFMMRSQLDCSDDRLPRKTFDLKTRAVVAVRMDRANWVEASGYPIRSSTGVWESFERELYDMSRGTLLKYYFQARIGDMDGIMVAYHSTSTMFGFQYLPREDLAKRLFGSEEMGEQAFRLAIGLLERTLDTATSCYPDHTLRITVDAQAESMPRNPRLLVFVRPVHADGTAMPDDDIFQFEIEMDRYLSDALIEGPIDFHAPLGRRVNATDESEIERRGRSELPALEWMVEYSIWPRGDLAKDEMRKRLAAVHKRLKSVAALALPNVEALNARERSRHRALSENPDALRQYVKDRENGLAAAMPLAPGQIVLGLDDEVQLAKVDDATSTAFGEVQEALAADDGAVSGDSETVHVLGVDGGDVTAASADFVEEGREAVSRDASGGSKQVWSEQKAHRMVRMRTLAQMGQKDKDEQDKTDEKIVFERRG